MTTDSQPATTAAAANPLARDGKVSYLEIPAIDVARSAAFYASVFGWSVRNEGDTRRRGFDDAPGEIVGAFVAHLPVAPAAGVLPYVYVADIDAAIAAIEREGCALIQAKYAEGDLWVATFRDPAGNTIGIWQFQ
jgi:predicted enzyme related to lactoylglutathione lyase